MYTIAPQFDRSASIATALITGAGRGLGLELVRQYGRAGWRVIACARAPARSLELTQAARASSGAITIHALDVLDHAAIDALAGSLAATPIDVLLNVAGVLHSAAFGKTDYACWTESLRINTLAPLKMSEAFVAQVAASEHKKIVTVSSILGSIGANQSGGMYDYRSTKAAVNAVMKSMSIDLAPRGILALALHPGWVRTAMGGPRADIDAETSAAGMIRVIAALTSQQSGKLLDYQGAELPW